MAIVQIKYQRHRASVRRHFDDDPRGDISTGQYIAE